MRRRTPVTLFPFLSVLISTMGVLSFLAVTFLLFVSQEQTPAQPKTEVKVSWVGAPPHVRPLLVECRSDGARIQFSTGREPQFFSLRALEEEVKIVKRLEQRGIDQLGARYDRTQLWLYMKNAVPKEKGLQGSYTLSMHRLELYNLSGEGRRRFEQRFPILLVYSNGVDAFELVSYLVETTTRLNIGLEPMLEGWALPYQEQAS